MLQLMFEELYQIFFLLKNYRCLEHRASQNVFDFYVNYISGPESEKIKKKLCKIFKKHGLNITVECNLRITDFLDVTFDLRTRKYYPYRKVNNELLYIHKQSNHPLSITRQIPAMISKIISNISCDKECFDKAALDYNNALKNWFQRKYQIHTMSSKKKKTQQKHFMV